MKTCFQKSEKDDSYLTLLSSGINSNILLNRPDIKELEYKLRAKMQILVLQELLFPSISLTASTGFASSSLNNLFQIQINFGK